MKKRRLICPNCLEAEIKDYYIMLCEDCSPGYTQKSKGGDAENGIRREQSDRV